MKLLLLLWKTASSFRIASSSSLARAASFSAFTTNGLAAIASHTVSTHSRIDATPAVLATPATPAAFSSRPSARETRLRTRWRLSSVAPKEYSTQYSFSKELAQAR